MTNPGLLKPPHSKDSEMMVLGCMLTSSSSLNVGADSLDDADFYYNEHKLIFQILKNAYKSDKPADIHIVCEELKRQEKLKTIGGAAYVTSLAQYAGTSAYTEEYVSIVRNHSILRRMIYAAQNMEKKALEGPEDVQGCLDDAQKELFQISQSNIADYGKTVEEIIIGTKSESKKSFEELLIESKIRYELLGQQSCNVTGIPTGFIDLDRMINGLGKSNFIVLACRPSMGKTALSLNIAQNVSNHHKIPVGIFSLEMSADQLVQRMICFSSGISSTKIVTGELNQKEYDFVLETSRNIKKLPIIIDDQSSLKITDIRTRSRRMVQKDKVGLIIIDYLGLINGSTKQESRQMEISEISRMLKSLARELNVPILCCAQLSRKVEERATHRPIMSDLRDSGSIEQDADVVMFLYRREYYDPNDKPGVAEIIVSKNRHGPVGNIQLAYSKEIAKFENYTTFKGL